MIRHSTMPLADRIDSVLDDLEGAFSGRGYLGISELKAIQQLILADGISVTNPSNSERNVFHSTRPALSSCIRAVELCRLDHNHKLLLSMF